MCGLLGYWMREPDERTVVLTAVLASYMEERGSHSWGVYHDGEITRGLGSITEGMDVSRSKGTRVLMGHTRFASVGPRTLRNAHPFVCGKVIGCHNGGVSNYKEMNEKYGRKFECDSEHIFAHIDESKPIDELHGHGAFTWVSGDPDSISMVRSPSGDLEVGVIHETADKKSRAIGIAWASTPGPLKKALAIAGFSFTTQWVKGEKRHFIVPAENDLFFFAKEERWEFGSPPRTIVPALPPITGFGGLGREEDWQRSDWSGWHRRPPLTAPDVPFETKGSRRKQRKAAIQNATATGNGLVVVSECYSCKATRRVWWVNNIGDYLCFTCKEGNKSRVDETVDAIRRIQNGLALDEGGIGG